MGNKPYSEGQNNRSIYLNASTPMIPAVNQFFDDVLVMVDEEDIPENRLGLLHRLAAMSDGAADMSRLEGF